jgi:hypothetical protein
MGFLRPLGSSLEVDHLFLFVLWAKGARDEHDASSDCGKRLNERSLPTFLKIYGKPCPSVPTIGYNPQSTNRFFR